METEGLAGSTVGDAGHHVTEHSGGGSNHGGVAARPQLIREMNEQLLLERVRHEGPISRPELARGSGLSKPTVALALGNLEADGLVRVAGHRTGVRGPAAVLYEVRPEAGYVLGLDVGREYLRGALADLSGAVRAKTNRRAHAASAHSRLAELQVLADELTSAAGITRSKVTQTVVGSPGVYDASRGSLIMARNLPGWERPGVLAELRQVFGRTTVVENDIDLAALAERDHGHGREVGTFAFVSVGTGIGMGLVLDGTLHRGAHGATGEIAYLPIANDGVDPVEARRHGLLEAAASAAAVVRGARRRGLGGALSARRVFAAAAAGDERARATVEEEAMLIAKAITAIIAVIDPEMIVLGGGIGRAPGFAAAVVGALETVSPFVPEVRVSAARGGRRRRGEPRGGHGAGLVPGDRPDHEVKAPLVRGPAAAAPAGGGRRHDYPRGMEAVPAETREAGPDPALFETVVNLCKRRGFVFPSAEIYGGFRSTYDYGPLGALMLRNVREAWFRAMVQERDDVVSIDAAILTNPKVWEASGHLATFTDPLVDCRNCNERWRADQIGDTLPQLRLVGPDRGAPVQPHVQDLRRPGRGRAPPSPTCARRRPRACS